MSKKTLMIVGSVVILLLTLILIPSKKDESSQNNSAEGSSFFHSPTDIVEVRPGVYINRGIKSPPAQKQEDLRIQSGILEVNSREWRGVVNNDDRMRTDMKMLTEGVYWEVRLDRDNRRIHQMYPKGWKPGSHLEITNDFTVMECRITPGQEKDRAEIAWSITPK